MPKKTTATKTGVRGYSTPSVTMITVNTLLQAMSKHTIHPACVNHPCAP